MSASPLRSLAGDIWDWCGNGLLWLLAPLILGIAHAPVQAQACVAPPGGMVAWWPMDETGGTAVADIIGANHGIRVNGPVSAPGLVEGSLRFNGSNSYVGAPDSDLWAFGAGDFTIELWANWDFNPVGTVGHPGTIFIGNDEGAGSRNKWFFALGGGFLNFHINSSAIGPRFFPLVPFSPIVGQWHHLAVTKRGNIYILYVNGAIAGSAIDNNSIPNPSSPLTIGQAESLGFMNGRLDEVTVYSRALGQPEVHAIVNAGAGGKCKALQIASKSLPDVKLGVAASNRLEPKFGRPPYFWTTSAGGLPSGMTLSADGTVAGTPTESGVFSVTIRVTDADNASADRAFAQRVLLTLPPPIVRTSKAGTLAVPGRVSDYFILVENMGSTEEDVFVTEVPLPPNHFILGPGTPVPDLETGVDYSWLLESIRPGESKVLQYSVRLGATVPLGTLVAGGLRGIVVQKAVPPITREVLVRTLRLTQWDSLKAHLKTLPCGDPAVYPEVHRLCPPATRFEVAGCVAALDARTRGCPVPGLYPRDWTVVSSTTAGAVDPNEKLSVAPRYIKSDHPLLYPIHFENIGTIEARDVFVTDVIDTNLDLSTLKFLSPGGSLDIATRTLRWELLGRNLLPGASDSVLVSALPKLGLPSGAVIRNKATIRFEVFAPFTTNEVVNVIDDVAPRCKLDSLPPVTRTLTFPVSWTGSDVVGEVDSYSVWVSKDRAAFTQLLEASKDTRITFSGVVGSRYDFLCVSRDTAGNIETKLAVGEVGTFIEPIAGDLNGDGKVDCADLAIVKASFGKRNGQPGYDTRADVIKDGVIDVRDLAFVSQRLPAGTRCS